MLPKLIRECYELIGVAMPDPTYDQLIAFEDAVHALREAGMSRDDVIERCESALDDYDQLQEESGPVPA